MSGFMNGAGDFLTRVDQRLTSALSTAPTEGPDGTRLYEAARHLVLVGGGKRVRPRLAQRFGSAAGADLRAMEPVAAAAELIHAASLLHDDVVDEASVRRGLPTVNAAYDATTAVLAGDLTLTLAFEQIKELPTAVTHSAFALLSEMTRAAIVEVQHRRDPSFRLTEWIAMAEGKTGALFGWCGECAGIIADDHVARATFREAGRRLGVAFQLADDLHDVLGSDTTKERFADLRNANPNAVVIMAAEDDPRFRKRLAACWSGEVGAPTWLELGQELSRGAAIELALERLRRESEATRDALAWRIDREPAAEIVGWATQLYEYFVAQAAS